MASGYTGCSERNLTSHEVLAPTLTLMVEQNTVATKHTVAFAVVLHHPEAIELRHTVRRARIKRRSFPLQYFLHHAIQLRGRSLVDTASVSQSYYAHSLQQSQHTYGIHLSSELRHVETHLHMTLCCQVIYLVRTNLADDTNQRRTIRHVTPVQLNQAFLLHVTHPLI